MKAFVLYDRAGIHSGKVLGEKLAQTLGAGHSVAMGRPKDLERAISSGQQFDFIVNVGWFGAIKAPGSTILNRPGAIAVSSNKLRARRRFKEEGVPAPELWENPNSIPESAYPVVARTTHHSKGRGFWYCKNKKEAEAAAKGGISTRKKLVLTRKGNKVWRERPDQSPGASHFLKFIEDTREFRVHAISQNRDVSSTSADKYLVLKLSEKVESGDGPADQIIKNHDRGWIFSFPKDKNDPVLDKVRAAAKKALASFGLHWGAVDIMYCKKANKVYVLEINSTPCLTDDQANTLDKYVRGIGSLLGTSAPLKRKKKTAKPQKKYVGLLNRLGV